MKRNAHRLRFELVRAGYRTTVAIEIERLVIAGWTGRDKTAVEKHIAELKELGVAPPFSTPTYYPVSAARLSTATDLQVLGETSSGEVEVVLVKYRGRLLIGVGSDHTDRQVETYSVGVSKQMCDKPIAPRLWEF